MSIQVATLYTAFCDECQYAGPDHYREDRAMEDEQKHKATAHEFGGRA